MPKRGYLQQYSIHGVIVLAEPLLNYGSHFLNSNFRLALDGREYSTLKMKKKCNNKFVLCTFFRIIKYCEGGAENDKRFFTQRILWELGFFLYTPGFQLKMQNREARYDKKKKRFCFSFWVGIYSSSNYYWGKNLQFFSIKRARQNWVFQTHF